jgi:hypothetical protein
LRHRRFDVYATTISIEAYDAVYQREDGIIPTEPHISSWQKLCTPLAHNDISSYDLLASEFLETEALTNAVAPIFYAALTFFVCHTSFKIL